MKNFSLLLKALVPFTPKTFVCLKEGYSATYFLDDLKAGMSVGLIALPLAMAFAIGSGVAPEQACILPLSLDF